MVVLRDHEARLFGPAESHRDGIGHIEFAAGGGSREALNDERHRPNDIRALLSRLRQDNNKLDAPDYGGSLPRILVFAGAEAYAIPGDQDFPSPELRKRCDR